MKKYLKKILILLILLVPIFSPYDALAQTERPYTFLAPLEDQGVAQNADLSSYLEAMMYIIMGIAAVLAFIMITFGGITYATTDAISGKEKGKEYIINSLYGFLLLLGAYAIMNTINPRTLILNLSEIPNPNISTSSSSVVSGGTPTPGGGSTAGGTCTDCVAITGVIAGRRNNNNISATVLPKLQALSSSLRSSGVVWRITEAYPPTMIHQNPCHRNGTCIDANVSLATVANINAFAQAATSAGLTPVYEVKTTEDRDRLVRQGVTARIDIVSKITAPHFSVYNN